MILLIFFSLTISPTYCFPRASANHERLIDEIKEQRRESSQELEKKQPPQAPKGVKVKIKPDKEQLAVKEAESKDKSASEKTNFPLLIVALVLAIAGLMFYRFKKKQT
jgi:LPXTG-motif cell wall-anchored protein